MADRLTATEPESLPDELVDKVVDLLKMRAKAPKDPSDCALWIDKMLRTACRHIEYFVEPEISIKAAAR